MPGQLHTADADWTGDAIVSIAKLLGEPPDPPMEEAYKVFYGVLGGLEQAEKQTGRFKPTPLQRRRMEWKALKEIIDAYRKAFDDAKSTENDHGR